MKSKEEKGRTLEEVMDRLDKTPMWEKVYYSIRRKAIGLFDIKSHYRQIKWFIQRGRYGWSPYDCWNLCYYLAKIISESTEYLKDNHMAYPGNGTTDEEWTEILEQISKYFAKVNNVETVYDNVDYRDKKALVKAHTEETKMLEEALKGFDILKKWFYYLGD